MNWFKRFMYGRYGNDQLSMFLLILGLIISIITSFFDYNYIGLISYIPLIYALYRIFSKNIYKRQQENYKFLRLFNPIKNKINRKRIKIKDKSHKYFKCKECKTILRVPKGKGKLSITCPKCKNKAIKKT